MESTPSPNGNTFYCPECKQRYPLSSKEYHDIVCGESQRNNSKKESINLNAAPCGKNDTSDKDKKESTSQSQYPVWEEEEKKNNDDDFEDLQSVLEQIKQQEEEEKKKEEENDDDGVLSKIKKYGKKIAFAGAGIGLCALGSYIGSSPVIKIGMRAIAHSVVDQPDNEDNTSNEIASLLSDDDDIFVRDAQRENSNSRKNQEIIKLLPVSEIKDNEHKPKGNCTICLADFSVKDKVTTLPCLHIFHHQCIDVWLKDHNVCPLCKLELNNKNLGLE